MTARTKSQIAHYSDVVLNVQVKKEACPFNLAPTSSTTAMLAMGDALAMCVLDARGFRKSDYARLHPAGAIGSMMLVQIKDIMRTGERNAVIPEYATVKDALLAMTKAKSGTISVVDSKGRVAGVFTDGDFRRHIARDTAAVQAQVKNLMTRDTIAIRQDKLDVA